MKTKEASNTSEGTITSRQEPVLILLVIPGATAENPWSWCQCHCITWVTLMCTSKCSSSGTPPSKQLLMACYSPKDSLRLWFRAKSECTFPTDDKPPSIHCIMNILSISHVPSWSYSKLTFGHGLDPNEGIYQQNFSTESNFTYLHCSRKPGNCCYMKLLCELAD